MLAFKVDCRVLGLMEKLVTGPLWRIMVKEKCVLNMSTHYHKLLTCFEKWADDSPSIRIIRPLVTLLLFHKMIVSIL